MQQELLQVAWLTSGKEIRPPTFSNYWGFILYGLWISGSIYCSHKFFPTLLRSSQSLCWALIIAAVIDSGYPSGVILWGGFKLSITFKALALWCISLNTHFVLQGSERHAEIADWDFKGEYIHEIPRGFNQVFNYFEHKYPKALSIRSSHINGNFLCLQAFFLTLMTQVKTQLSEVSKAVSYPQLIIHYRNSLT